MLSISLAFTSCAVDDDPAIQVNQEAAKVVSFGQPQYIVPTSNTMYNLPIDISPSSFGSNYLIEYTVDGVAKSASITGGQSAQIQLDVSNTGSIEIELNRVSVLGTEAGTIDATKKSTKVLIAPAVNPNALEMVLAWPDASNNDLDFYVTDVDTFIVDRSLTTSAGEDIALPNSEPDGDYRVFVRNWSSVLDPIPFTILTTAPDGTSNVYTGTIPNVRRQYNEALTIVKTGSTYAITQLDPTVPL